MATGLTHSFSRKADIMMSTPAAQQFGEPWDIFPDPDDPHEKHNDEGRTEFGVFGPMPSNPAKRARYMLLANYLELAGSGATMNGASEREKREEEQHFERSIYAYTLHQIDEQIHQVDQEIGRVKSDLAGIRRELAFHRANLDAMQVRHGITQDKIREVTTNGDQAAAQIKASQERLQESATEHAQARSDIQEKIRLAEEKYVKEASEFAAKNGFEYDPKTRRFTEMESGRTVSVYAHPELMDSFEFLEMQRAGLEVFDLKQQAGQIDKAFNDKRRMEEKFLETMQGNFDRNATELANLRVLLAQQEQEIALEEKRISELQVAEKEKVQELVNLQAKKDHLQEIRDKVAEMDKKGESIRGNMAYATQIRETMHSSRLALFANDPASLARENEAFAKFQTASAGICTVDPNKPLPAITNNFNALQALVAEEKSSTQSKGPGANAQDPAAVTADAAQLPPKDGSAVDPVNGDVSADASSVADPAKPVEQKQDQQTADAAADQPAAAQDGAQQNQPQQQHKKLFTNTNSGIG